MQGLLSIGRFSQACRLSVRTLRRYDADQVLVPALIDPGTLRRYYSPAQLGEAELIRRLRALDVPVADVRRLLGERDPVAVRQRLAEHRERVAAHVAEQQAVLSELDALLAGPDQVSGHQVQVRRLPEQLVVAARCVTSLERLPGAFGATLGRLEQHLHEHGSERRGPTIALYHGEEFDPEAVDLEVAVPVATWTRVAAGITVRTLGAQDAACTVHSGPYEGIHAAYRSLAGWAARHGHELGTPAREVYLVGPDRAAPEGWRTEVVWPLRCPDLAVEPPA